MKALLPEHLNTANARDVFPIFYLELVNGLRKEELVVLRWSDLDTAHKTISVNKQYVHFHDLRHPHVKYKTKIFYQLIKLF